MNTAFPLVDSVIALKDQADWAMTNQDKQLAIQSCQAMITDCDQAMKEVPDYGAWFETKKNWALITLGTLK